MTVTFVSPTFNKSGVSTQAVWDLMAADFGKPWTVKELLTALGFDLTENNIKNVSNRCSYLVQQGQAERIAQGTYALVEKGTAMTVTEIAVAEATSTEPMAPPKASAEFQCPECGFQARSQMGLRTHITKNHKPGLTPDQAFERIGEACEVLFPDGLPMSRVIEIAELQRAMLKVVTRK